MRHLCDITAACSARAGSGSQPKEPPSSPGPTMISPDSGANNWPCLLRMVYAAAVGGTAGDWTRRWTSRWRPNGTRPCSCVSFTCIRTPNRADREPAFEGNSGGVPVRRDIGDVRPLLARRSVLMRRPPSPTPGARYRSLAGLAGTIPAIRRVVRFPSGSRRRVKCGSCRSPGDDCESHPDHAVGRAVGSPPGTDLLREFIALPRPAASLGVLGRSRGHILQLVARSSAGRAAIGSTGLLRKSRNRPRPPPCLLRARVARAPANKKPETHRSPSPAGWMFWLRWNTLSGSQRALTSERRR